MHGRGGRKREGATDQGIVYSQNNPFHGITEVQNVYTMQQIEYNCM